MNDGTRPAKPIDFVVNTVGTLCVILGIVLVAVSLALGLPAGSYGVVPSIMAGLQTIVVGEVAFVIADVRVDTTVFRVASWLALLALIVSTCSILILTRDALGRPMDLDPALAETVVLVGRVVIVVGVIAGALWLVLSAIIESTFLARRNGGQTIA